MARRCERDDVAVPTERPAIENHGGLELLLDRLWGQEVTHKLVLAELLRHTDLGTRLGLWNGNDQPTVVVEPDRGIFDLALARGSEFVKESLPAAVEAIGARG